MRADENHALLLVAGDASPLKCRELSATQKGKVKVFANLKNWRKCSQLLQQKSIYVVAQTTFRVESWEKCKEFLKNSVQKPKFLIQYVMQRGRGNRKRKTSAKMRSYGRHWWSSFFQYPKSFYRSLHGML